MRETRRRKTATALARYAISMAALGLSLGVQAAQFNINVVDGDGNPVSGFRWLVQQDTTYAVDPTNPPPLDQQLALNFHKSHHPLALTQGNAGDPNAGQPLSGNTDADGVTVNYVEPGRYYVSVLPYSGHAMGGAPVTVLPNAQDPNQDGDNITIVVEPYQIPTAQIAVYLFHDCYPLNGAPDLPEEEVGSTACPWAAPDFTKFSVEVEEPGGKYGANGGPLLQDAFGNPLGTTYSDTNGTVKKLGNGTLSPNADGTLLIKNLAPAKYGIKVNPPTGAGWTQTSTIEGTRVIDAWVKANEPPFMVEFGLPGPHVFVGFTQERNDLTGGSADVSGTITDMHMSRPPATELFSGRPFPQCWVAINEGGAAPGVNRYAMPCNADSSFSIPGVPAGSYELKVFDTPLDVVIATLAFTVNPDGSCSTETGSCDFGEVPVFNWFNRLTTYLFDDKNQNGFWDAGETNLGAENGPVNVRWRDGTVYQSFPTDFEGVAPFDESFPWFHWMVAEVGFTNKKATGATMVVDAGGEIISTGEFPDYGELNPQIQADGQLWRTETGPVLTQAFQGFLGQTNVIHFGKAEYLNLDFNLDGPPTYVGENGGISGIVFNTVTRAENDPRFAVGEGWEPGVPRVQVNLYADGDIDSPVLPPIGQPFPVFPNGEGDVDWNGDGIYQADDGVIDDLNGDGVTLADVDNYPLGWGDPNCVNSPAIPGNECNRGAEDVDHNGNGVFDLGDALAVAWTDSWDDNTPTGCQGQNNMAAVGIADDRCFDGMRNWNQVRPGVFDGGYAFNEYDLDHLGTVRTDAATTIVAKIQAFYDSVRTPARAAKLPEAWLLPGDYIVEATTPPGYETLREHHKNVDFGDEFQPAPEALPPVCVGPEQPVPALFALSTKDGSGDLAQIIPGVNAADAAAPFAGDLRPVCDQKLVPLNGAQNAAADFFLVSEVPVAANVTGVILNDLANEFNPNSPNFGEKYAPPLVPVGFYDWNGKQVNRVYADEYGRYNAMVPSTWSANLPMPSGMSPNMLISCMNDAGPIPDPQNPGELIVDPNFNPAFSQFCYTFQFMPGSATYLDTPVVAIAAFTTPTTYPVDCEQPTRTPMIATVERHNNSGGGGPFVVRDTPQPQRIVIRSRGRVTVPNPEWDGTNAKTIVRDYRFDAGNNQVWLVDANGVETQIDVVNSNRNQIVAEVPTGTDPGDYQVLVRSQYPNTGFVESPMGVTLTVGVCQGSTSGRRCNGLEAGVRPDAVNPLAPTLDELYAVSNLAPGASIQAAIDQATPGDLILVPPGQYNELLVMWKPVKLQGWGADKVFINARQTPTEKVQQWRAKVDELLEAGSISLLPGQANNVGGFPALGAPAFPTEEGAGIFVAGRATGLDRFGHPRNRGSRIDGFTVLGASQGGGIVVNGYAQFLNIGNNLLTANAGFYGGGIRVGHPGLTADEASYTDSVNDWVRIHHNLITKNGGMGGAGGGISLHTGADQYRVQENWICGNYTQGNGGGIGHMGLSNGGRMEHNDVLFNESFSQANSVHGGGIFVGGETPLAPTNGLLLSEGSGNVVIDANRIHGNLAGAGDGGGIAIVNANGIDVATNLSGTLENGNPASSAWWDLSLFNNMITNNVAGLAGAITLQDSVEVHVVNNTVAHNESTATVARAFTPGTPNQSNPQPAGLVSRLHSPDMEQLLVGAEFPANGGRDLEYLSFSDANFNNNIVFANRSFFWLNYGAANTITQTGLFPANCVGAPAGCNLTDFAAYTDDLAVLDGSVDTGDTLFVRYGLLTAGAEDDASGNYVGGGNLFTADPVFVNPVFNEGQDGVDVPEFTVLQTAAALDEGGNFIQVSFSPLTIVELGSNANQRVFYDYHIQPGSPAEGAGQNVGIGGPLGVDFDGDPRTNGNTNEIGADEL